ncbi:hypothetical protein CU669_20365 [Paramagnetospirillum kuznetsovii]|uniref:NYN domain-containing protein n=2 Tax=Paramagnetospirillum kuznetsovii TaxID=2053833 RepID=A0A364NSL9_9PROT|nr:hypothetical protein CU669_20365 [Paramagnetospirillum kuznetsovii]
MQSGSTSLTLPAGEYSVAGVHPVRGAEVRKLTVGHNHVGGRRKSRTKPAINAVTAEVHAMEEKGSDVNLAVHLLNDAWKGEFDAAAVITNDTDLCEPIRMVAQERGFPVTVICPTDGTGQSMAPKLQAVASFSRHIHTADLTASQFPDSIPGTNLHKPPNW